MKRFLTIILAVLFLCLQCPVFSSPSDMKIYADKIDGYKYKTVLKHYQPYSLTMINQGSETIYFTSDSFVKFQDENEKYQKCA